MLTARGRNVIKTMLIKTLDIKVSFQWTFEDSQRWAATDRVRQTVPGARSWDGEGAVLRPLLYVASYVYQYGFQYVSNIFFILSNFFP